MFRTVIFDLDGTLLDTLADLAGAANHVLASMGCARHAPDDYRLMVGSGAQVLVRRMLPAGSSEAQVDEALRRFVAYYSAHENDNTAPYPGIPALLETLGRAGVVMGVLSNKPHENTARMVARFFPGAFALVQGQKPGLPRKPDPTALLAMLDTLGAHPAFTLYVGDSDVDMHTAKNAGLAHCGVLWGFRGEAELRAAGATCLAGDTGALLDIVLAG